MQSDLELVFDTSTVVRLEDFLTVGSKIFLQTHFVPLIKMQGFAKEIFLTFRSKGGIDYPILLNVKRQTDHDIDEVHCCGMIISNRNRFEKELLTAKNVAEEALSKNEELQKIRLELEEHQRELELQIRTSAALHRQNLEIFKVISHDLQEPLRKSVLFADLIKSQNTDLPLSATEKLDRIIAFNQHMRDMVMSLQRLGELETSKIVLQNIDFEKLLNEALTLSGIASETVKIEYQIGCKSIYGDEVLIKTMFVELFLNALRFCNSENEFCIIQISTVLVKRNIFIESSEKYRYEDFLKITFADNGIGFNADSSKVFQVFQRGEQFDKVSPGLAYCLRVVELHFGTIIAKSITGKGAGFTIFLPYKAII